MLNEYTNLDRTGDRKFTRAHGRKDVKDVVSWNFDVSELREHLFNGPAYFVAVII